MGKYYEVTNVEKIGDSFKEEDLYLEGYHHDASLSIVDFIHLFLVKFNKEFDTIYNNTKELQCCSGRHRSLGDICNICRAYYPEITIEEVKEILLDFGSYLVGHYCPDIEKRVYALKTGQSALWGQGAIGGSDEFENPISYRKELKHNIKF